MHLTTRLPALLVVATVSAGCDLVALGKNALTYPTLHAGDAGNVVARGAYAYVTLADSGFALVDVNSGRRHGTIAPPTGMGSVDDIAVHDEFLFVLDARSPGFLAAFSLRDPLRPRLADQPRSVPVGPFSGISAREGVAIVSGGTSELTVWRYDSSGALDGPTTTIDLGRGQPDVLIARHADIAFVSTHYWGPYFGLDIVRYDNAARTLSRAARVELPGAGFTAGGAKPANFPIEAAQLDDSTVVVGHARGLAFINVRDPASPRLMRTVDVGGAAVNVDAMAGTLAVVVSAPPAAVVLIDATSNEPKVVRRITLPPGTNPSAVALSEGTVVLAARNQGILVFQR